MYPAKSIKLTALLSRTYKCNECSYETGKHIHLVEHVRLSHPENEIPVTLPIRSDPPQKPGFLFCRFCEFSCSEDRRRTMWEHLYYHTGEPIPFMMEEKSSLVYSYRGYSCSFCRYTQFSKIHIEDHIRVKHCSATICPSTLVKSHIFNMISNVGDESSSSELSPEYQSSDSIKNQGLVIKQFYGNTDKNLPKKNVTLARFDITSSKAKTINLKEKRKKLQELVDQRAKSKELSNEKKSHPKSNVFNNSVTSSQFNDNQKQIFETNSLPNALSKNINTATQSNIFLNLSKQLKHSDEQSNDSTKSPIPKIIGLKAFKCVISNVTVNEKSEIIKPISNFLEIANETNISLNSAEEQKVISDTVISDATIHEKGSIINGVEIDSNTNVIHKTKSLTFANTILSESRENTYVNKIEQIPSNENLNKLKDETISNQEDIKLNPIYASSNENLKDVKISNQEDTKLNQNSDFSGITSPVQLVCKANIKNDSNNMSCSLREISKPNDDSPSTFEKPISMKVNENSSTGIKELTPESLTFTNETLSQSNTLDQISNTELNISLINENISLNSAQHTNSTDTSNFKIELKKESNLSVVSNIKSLTVENSTCDHALLQKNDLKIKENEKLDTEELINDVLKSSVDGINSSGSEFQNDAEENIAETIIKKQKIITEVVENFMKISEEIDQIPLIKCENNLTPESCCKTKVAFESEQVAVHFDPKISDDENIIYDVLSSNKDDKETSDANVLDKILTLKVLPNAEILPNVPFDDKEIPAVLSHKDDSDNYETLNTDVLPNNIDIVKVSLNGKETSVLPINNDCSDKNETLPSVISTTLALTNISPNKDDGTFSSNALSNSVEKSANDALCSDTTTCCLPEISTVSASTNNNSSTLDEIFTTDKIILDVLSNNKEMSSVDILPENEKISLGILPNKENSTDILCNNEKTSTPEALSNKKEIATSCILSNNEDISTANHLPVNKETVSIDSLSINEEIIKSDEPFNNEAFNASASNNEKNTILTKNKPVDILPINEKENETVISQNIENPEIKDILANDFRQNLVKGCYFHPLIDSCLNLQSSNSSEKNTLTFKNISNQSLEDKIVIVCQNCNYVCTDWHAIVEHLAAHNSTVNIQLQFLDEIPESQEKFPIFIQDPNICGCGSCLQSASTIELLHDHIHNCHQETAEFVCKHCKKMYRNDKEFCSHLNFHGPELYKCRLCSFIHWKANDVASHMLLHHHSNEKLILIRKLDKSKNELTDNSSEIVKQQVNVDNLLKPMEKSTENISNYANEALIARTLLKMTKASISNEKEIVFNCSMCKFSSQVQYLVLRHCEKEHLNSMEDVNAIKPAEESVPENTLSIVNSFQSQKLVENNLNQNKEKLDLPKIPKTWNLFKENIVKDLKCLETKPKLGKKLNSEVKDSHKKLKLDCDDEPGKVTSLLNNVQSKAQVKKLACKRTNVDTLSSQEDFDFKRFKNISIEERVKIKRLIKSDDGKLHKDKGPDLAVFNSNKIENDAVLSTKKNKSLKTGCNDNFKDISVLLELKDKDTFSVPYKELKKYMNLCPRVLLER